jgi:hypothetical protein
MVSLRTGNTRQLLRGGGEKEEEEEEEEVEKEEEEEEEEEEKEKGGEGEEETTLHTVFNNSLCTWHVHQPCSYKCTTS